MHASPATNGRLGPVATPRAANDSLRRDHTARRLDDAARAGWLYYAAGDTQDEIARKLRVSRQTAQRLVSLSVSEGLVKVRLDHRIARCMELGERLQATFGLGHVDVVPSDPAGGGAAVGLAQAMAAEMELRLAAVQSTTFAVGTGRTLKAAAEQLMPVEARQHSIVSLAGNIAPDGTAASYNVIFTMADRIRARFFPLPLPVIASSAGERRELQSQPMVRETLRLAAEAETAFVGIGHLGPDAPLALDGFLKPSDHDALIRAGAVGEIVGWVFDAEGLLVEGLTNSRVAGAAIPSRASCEVMAVVAGEAKLRPLLGALRGRLISGLITDEATAVRLLQDTAASSINRSAGRI